MKLKSKIFQFQNIFADKVMFSQKRVCDKEKKKIKN